MLFLHKDTQFYSTTIFTQGGLTSDIHRNLECVKVLLDNGAEVNTQRKASVVLVDPFRCISDVRPPCVKIVVL